MPELLQEYWIFLLVALLLGLLVAFWVFHLSRRTKVQLENRPDNTAATRNQALIDSVPAAATSKVAPAPTPPAASVPPAGEPPSTAAAAAADDLSRIKGVGPKLAATLNQQGITSLAQIAAWDDAAIDRIDAQLGRFSGRIRRDEWVEQARLLTADDLTGYETRFGKV